MALNQARRGSLGWLAFNVEMPGLSDDASWPGTPTGYPDMSRNCSTPGGTPLQAQRPPTNSTPPFTTVAG
jgi:hypothetical protein